MRLPNTEEEWNWWSHSKNIPIGDVILHPDWPWDRYGLSQNEEMTLALMDELDQVMTNAVGEWDWDNLSRYIPMEEIRLHPDLPWERYGLSMNKDITVEAMNHLDQVMTNATGEWNWRSLSRMIPIGDIRLHPDLPWVRGGLSWIKEMTLALMDELDQVMTNAVGNWDWYALSKVIPMDEIRLHPDLPWVRGGLSWKKDITVALMDELDEVLTNATGEWAWYTLSIVIPIGDIRAHPDWPWDRYGLSINKDITVEAVDYLDQMMTSAGGEWSWYALSNRVPIEDIRARPDLPWSRRGLSQNKDITVEAIDYLDQVMTNATGDDQCYR